MPSPKCSGRIMVPHSELRADEGKGKKRDSYLLLRQALDSLELMSIRYYLQGKTKADRARRAGKIRGNAKLFMSRLTPQYAAGGCPPGYYNCDGFCVPYPCDGAFVQ